MSSYPLVFLLNLGVEAAVLLALLDVKHWKRILVMALLLNLATHPMLWFLMPELPGPWITKLLIGEVLVFGAEMALGLAFFRSHHSRARVLTAIGCANLATFLMTFLF